MIFKHLSFFAHFRRLLQIFLHCICIGPQAGLCAKRIDCVAVGGEGMLYVLCSEVF